MSKRFFITGITGQVGSQLADFLLANTDYEVIGLIRWQEPLDNIQHLTERINKGDRVFLKYGDLNDFPSLIRILRETLPGRVSHLAAQSFPKTSFDSPIETLQTNVIGTANILESLRQLRETHKDYNPMVHVCSSSEVYGRQKNNVPINEATPFHGASPYSISKIGTDLLGQFYAEAYGLATVVTRMGTHSGPRRSDVFFESTVAKQIALIEAGLQDPIIKIGNLESVRTYQDARDAVRAYYLLLEAMAEGKVRKGEVYNIAGSEIFHLKEVIQTLISMSTTPEITYEVDLDRLRPIDADYQMFDNAKIRAAIDWSPEISSNVMFSDLLDHWRKAVASHRIPLNR